MPNGLFERLPPSSSRPFSAESERYEAVVPSSLVAFWKEHGLPDCGLIRFVDPERFRAPLEQWVPPTRGRRYTPLAITAFGDLFYVRALGATDMVPDEHERFDLCFLDPHHRHTRFVGWDVMSTLDALDPQKPPNPGMFGFVPDFRPALAQQATSKLGPPTPDEAFHFAPALALGGSESIEHVRKGDAAVHLALLSSLG